MVEQHHQPRAAWMACILLALCLPGCQERSQAANYFLVGLQQGDPSVVHIYAVEDPDAVRHVGKWIEEHVNDSPSAQKARGLVLTFWHDELLRFDGQGHLLWSDYLCDDDVISPSDYAALKELFRQYGRRVETVPGRRPPRKRNTWNQLLVIEQEEPRAVEAAEPKRPSAPNTAQPQSGSPLGGGGRGKTVD
jgi:hypothetical protein